MINLKERRFELNMSEVEAAFKLGVTTQTISNWESNKSRPREFMKHKIAEVYQCPVSDLPFIYEDRNTEKITNNI